MKSMVEEDRWEMVDWKFSARFIRIGMGQSSMLITQLLSAHLNGAIIGQDELPAHSPMN